MVSFKNLSQKHTFAFQLLNKDCISTDKNWNLVNQRIACVLLLRIYQFLGFQVETFNVAHNRFEINPSDF